MDGIGKAAGWSPEQTRQVIDEENAKQAGERAGLLADIARDAEREGD